MTALVNHGYLRTARVTPGPDFQGVDRNENVIYGAKLIQEGPLSEADSRPWTVDNVTLEQARRLGARSKRGLKARFTHPNMSDDGLGTFLGYWRDLRIVTPQAGPRYLAADLHLAQAAFDSPRGDLGNYLLDLADSNPDAFGVSLATVLAPDMYDTEGEDEPTKDNPKPLRFARVHAADFVDEPAATTGGLFDVNPADPRDLAPLLDWAIDTHFPDLTEQELLAKAQRYLQRHFASKGQLPMTTVPNNDNPPADPPAELATDPPADPQLGAPAVETPDPPAPPAADDDPAPPIPAPELAADDRPDAVAFMEAFGREQGAVWFCEGRTFAEAAQLHREATAQRIAQLEQENEQLRAKLAELLGTDPLDTGAAPTAPAAAFRPRLRAQ